MSAFRITIYLILSFLFFGFTHPNFVGKSSVLEIKGYVFHKEDKIESATVKLYQNNKIVQMTKSKKGKFQFLLFSGIQYMIEINNAGFITERIQISTKEKTEYNGKYLYEFKVDLMESKRYEGIDGSNLDFPTAIIKYDQSEGEYIYDEAYSKQVKADLKTMKETARKKKK